METIRQYLIDDIEHLPMKDIHKLYKYVRTHLVANIDGLIDPLETSPNSDRAKCLDDLYENYPCRDGWDKADIAELLKKHFA